MAQVPQYSLPQEQTRPLPSVRQESVATPSLLSGAAAVGTETLSKGLSDAGLGLSAVAYHMQEREDATLVLGVEAARKEKWIAFEADAHKTRLGANAGKIAQDTKDWWDKAFQEDGAVLKTDAQRELYKRRMRPSALQTLSGMSKFQNQQENVVLEQNTKAAGVAAIDSAAAAPSEENVKLQIANGESAIRAHAKLAGADPKALDVALKDFRTRLHKQVIQALATSDRPAMAADYFTAHKDEIDGAQQAELGKYARTAAASSLGDTVAAAVWEKFKPKNSTDPILTADAIDAIRATPGMKDNPEALAKALQTFHVFEAALKDQRVQQSHSAIAAVVKEEIAGRFSTSSPAFVSLLATNPEAAGRLQAQSESRLATRESRAFTREGRALQAEQRQEQQLKLQGLDTVLEFRAKPEELVKASENQILAWRQFMGVDNVRSLLQLREHFLKDQAALSKAKIDADQFAVFANDVGLNTKPQSEAGKLKLKALQDRIETIAGLEQQRLKRPLSREETDAILKREINNTVQYGRWDWSSSATPAVAVPNTREARSRAYVQVGDARVRMADIPDTWRAEATAARASQGLATTEEILARLWLTRGKK